MSESIRGERKVSLASFDSPIYGYLCATVGLICFAILQHTSLALILLSNVAFLLLSTLGFILHRSKYRSLALHVYLCTTLIGGLAASAFSGGILSPFIICIIPPILMISYAKDSPRLIRPLAFFALATILLVYFVPNGSVPDFLTDRETKKTVQLLSLLFIVLFSMFIGERGYKYHKASVGRLNREQQLLETILESSQHGIYGTDNQGRITFFNSKASQILGWTAAEVLGRRHDEVFFREAENSLPEKISLFLNKEGGTVPVNYSIGAPLEARETGSESASVGQVVTFSDLTQQLSLRRELEERRMLSVQTAKLASLGEMAGSIAHEINTPLGSLLLSTQCIREDLNKSKPDLSQIQRFTEINMSTIGKISEIVQALKKMTRGDMSHSFEEAKVGEIVHDCLILCREKFKVMGIDLRIEDYCDGEATVTCLPAQVGQVLVNFLNNAQDAIEDLEEKWIVLETRTRGDAVEIAVINSGPPISPAIREKLFTPFFSTKPAGRGTGIGLSISQKIANRHGGRIFVDPDHPHTRFVLELPLQRKATGFAA